MNDIERLTEILNKANSIKQNETEMTFDRTPKFGFKIAEQNDIKNNIFIFNSISEFANLINTVCDNISISNATEIVTELLNENNIDKNSTFELTVFTS